MWLSAFGYDFSVDGIYYNFIGNNQVEVTCYSSFGFYSGDVTIPSSVTYNNVTYSVTSIGFQAFRDCIGLTSVTIPNSVTSIGSYVFYGCSGLTSVTIPNSVTSIGFGAFSYCSGLTSIIVEAGNTHYDSRNNCNAIIETSTNSLIAGCMNTVIPNSVTSIGSEAFPGCSGLTSVTIPNSVTSIGSGAFYDCSGLTSVTIPNRVTSIGFGAFYGCSGLTSVTIPNSMTSIGSGAFYGCSGLTSVTIPNSVTSIGSYAFSGCSGLTSVTIPNSVTSIDQYAFENCSSLTSVTIPKVAMPLSSYFPNSPITDVTIADGVDSIFSNAFHWYNLTSVAFPSSVKYIESGTLNGFSNLSSLTVEANNAKYDSRNNCNAIIETATNKLLYGSNSTIIPNGVTSIETNAFSGLNGLTSVTIPNSVTSIGSSAFSDCSGLTSVTIPGGVSSIEGYTFQRCSSLTSVTILNGVTTVYEYAFWYCKKLVSVSIPNSVVSIGNYALADCGNLAVINCNANIPPAIHEHTFGKYDATLYVPANSVGLYQSRDYWKNFFIMPIQEDGLEYSLADRNVDYLNGRIYNENGLEIRLYDAAGRLVTYSDGDIDMSNCPNGIYIVTDNKGGSLKIVHRR